MTKQQLSFIVVAGGVGKRLGANIPKQFLLLNNKPILIHTLERIFNTFGYLNALDFRLILVLNPDYRDLWQQIKQQYGFKLPVVEIDGGKERFHSVKNGLLLAFDQGIVAVHDAVRPFISSELLLKGWQLAQRFGSAVPYVLPKSSVRIEENGQNHAISREKVRLVQTPQFFDVTRLRKAYETDFKPHFTDDATVYEQAGYEIVLYAGDEQNIKITTEADFFLAKYLIQKKHV